MTVRTHFMNFYVPINDTRVSLEEKVEHFLNLIEKDLGGVIYKAGCTDKEHAYIFYQIIT